MTATKGSDIPVRLDGLQLDESKKLQVVIWSAQRIVWLLCAGLILLALFGATGQGGFGARRTVPLATGEVELPRVMRRGTADTVILRFSAPGEVRRLLLPADLSKAFEVSPILPLPAQSVARQEGTELRIDSLGPPPHVVTLTLTPRQAGRFTLRFTLDGATLAAPLTVLP